MGLCVSVPKHPESAMEPHQSTGPKNEMLLIPSPEKEKPAVDIDDCTVDEAALKSQWLPSSKEESFFDSQPWLESDCEDDFFSVNGDVTPSRGNTPVHHNFSLPNLQVNKVPVAEETNEPEPSPPDKRRRLSDLFKESLSVNEANTAGDKNIVFPAKNPENSIERTPNGMLRMRTTQSKTVKSGECCFPRLHSRRSFSDQRKKRTSPAQIIG